MPVLNKKRQTLVTSMHKAGASKREISGKIGVSVSRVQQILNRANGLCWCGKKPNKGNTICARHLEYMRKYQTSKRDEDRAAFNADSRERRRKKNESDPHWLRRQEQIIKNKKARIEKRLAFLKKWENRRVAATVCVFARGIKIGDRRLIRISTMLSNGKSYAEIGQEFNVSRQRIEQIIKEAEKVSKTC